MSIRFIPFCEIFLVSTWFMILILVFIRMMTINGWNCALYVLHACVCTHTQEIVPSFEYYKNSITYKRVCNFALLNVTMISRKIQHNIWLMGEMASLIIYCWMLCNMCFLLASTLECTDTVITSSVLYFVLYMLALNGKCTLSLVYY